MNCIICFETIKDADDNQRAILSCGHEFHPQCILKWFARNQSCPTCRQNHNKELEEAIVNTNIFRMRESIIVSDHDQPDNRNRSRLDRTLLDNIFMHRTDQSPPRPSPLSLSISPLYRRRNNDENSNILLNTLFPNDMST